jgi:hypothetical protein
MTAMTSAMTAMVRVFTGPPGEVLDGTRLRFPGPTIFTRKIDDGQGRTACLAPESREVLLRG